MAREDVRSYWEEQLAEYRGSGFSIPEYCELKELPYESARRWVRIFEKEGGGASGQAEENALELIEVKLPHPQAVPERKKAGVRLKVRSVDILLEKDFDQSVLSDALRVLGAV